MAGLSYQTATGPAFVDFSDAFGCVEVNGRKWNFEYHRYLGPLWLKADGVAERKCQNPNNAVWLAFDKWVKERNQ